MNGPGVGIAIKVGGAEDDEAQSDSSAEPEQKALPRPLLKLHQRAKQIAGGHHPDPWDKRVKDVEVHTIAERHHTGLMEDVPSPRGFAELFGSDAIEEIVPSEHDEGHACYGPAGQPDQCREYHHRGSDHEDDASG